MSNTTAPPPPANTINCTDDSVAGGLCYQIIPSSQLQTSLWLSAIGGALCLIAFAFLRGHKTWRPIYHKRATQISDLLCRPAPLRLTLSGGLQRFWSYLTPALTMSDPELLATAGLDTLILIRFIQMGIQMFLPLSIIVVAILLPIYRNGDALEKTITNNGTLNAESYMKNTLSNVSQGSVRLWAPWAVMIFVTVYCLWCLWAHCRSYAALQALHIHASVLIRGLDSKMVKKIKQENGDIDEHILSNGGDDVDIEKYGIEEGEEEQLIPIAGFMKLVGTRKSREERFGPGAKGWWKAVGKMTWQSINPLAMLRGDIELVELCVNRLDRRLTQLKKECEENEKAKKSARGAAFRKAVTFKRSATMGGMPVLDPRAEIQRQDWGPAVRAEVPDIVCPWWLRIEDTPAAVNPVLVAGGVLLGKTSPILRARVPGRRGKLFMWATACNFVVLYRAGGPTPTDHWGKFLNLNDRLLEAEKQLEEDTEQLLALDSSGENGHGESGSMRSASGVTSDDGGGSEEFGGSPEDSGKKGRKNFRKSMETVKNKILHYTSVERRLLAGQTLEKALKKLYPTTFKELVPVYNHIPADKAMQKWDHTAGELASVERELAQLTEKTGKNNNKSETAGVGEVLEEKEAVAVVDEADVELGAGKADSTTPLSALKTKREKKKAEKAAQKLTTLLQLKEKLTSQLAIDEANLAAAREACLAAPLGTAYFALFTDQRDARAAAAGNVGATPLVNMTSEMAPGPDEVNWQGLWAGWRERSLRTFFYCTIPMIVIILFPIGPLTGALTNLEVAVCGTGTSDQVNQDWAWFCNGPAVLTFIITVLLPITISTFWDTWVMPMVLFIVCQAQRSHASFSKLDQAVVSGFYAFSFINTFIGAVLGGSFLQQLGAAIQDGDIFTLVGTALPAASNFFLNYIGVHFLFTNIFRFIWPHDGTVLFVFFRYFGWCLPKCERDEWVIRSTPSYRSGRHYGAFQATYIMALSYAVVAPIILPITAGYFITAFITWRYSAIHFYDPCYDGAGRIFELSYTLTLVTLIMANIFAACVIMSKGVFWIGGSLIAVTVIIIVLFWKYCNEHVMRYSAAIPLQVAEISPSGVVPRELYLPPVLRKGSVGWFPEGGKIWEKYGLPKFVF